jgi:hypothetical protein
MISAVRCAHRAGEDHSSRWGGKDAEREPASYGWDRCAAMSQLSTTRVSGHGSRFLRRNR